MTIREDLRLRWPSTEWETGRGGRSKNPGKKGKKMKNGLRPHMAEKWPPKSKKGPRWDNGHGQCELPTLELRFRLFSDFWAPGREAP